MSKYIPLPFEERKCVICGSPFQGKGRRVSCSDKCRDQHNKNLRSATAKKWVKDNPERARESRKAYMARPEIREYRNTKHREYRKKRPEYISAIQKIAKAKWYAKPESKKLVGDYARAHKEYWKRSKAKRRMIESRMDSLPSAKVVRHRLDLFGGCCFCDRKEEMTLEHLIPISVGGDNRENNLFGSCRSCNSSKSAREWKSWYREKSFYKPEREIEIERYHNKPCLVETENAEQAGG